MSDRVRILAISGGGASSPEVYLKSALALGADRAIAKPFTMEQLVEAVEQLLAQPRPRAETEVEIEL
jgi:DNA-binding response OmpR family regulator